MEITPNAATFGICTECGAPRGWGQVETDDLHKVGMMCSADPSHETNVEVTHHEVTG